MTKIVAIGDIHGRDIWKRIIEKEKDTDMFVFIGDYFDGFDIPYKTQMENFKAILKFKADNDGKVILLIGNHDYHYITDLPDEHYSGYQDNHAGAIRKQILDAIDRGNMKVAYLYDRYLFTHAGLTKTWYLENGLECSHVENGINRLFKENPQSFRFIPSNPLDNYGDSITQSPIWVRPRALISDGLDGFVQIVGHTHQKSISVSEQFIFIDTFDTCNEYLTIVKGNILPKKLNGIIK